MRFGGFSEKGRAAAAMRAFKEQPVFDQAGQINEPRSELCFSFGYGREMNKPSAVELYLRGVSKEKVAKPWSMLFGVATTKFELIPAELAAIIQESLTRYNPETRYSELRWHDIIVLLVILRVYPKGTELPDFALAHLTLIARDNKGIWDYYEMLDKGEKA